MSISCVEAWSFPSNTSAWQLHMRSPYQANEKVSVLAGLNPSMHQVASLIDELAKGGEKELGVELQDGTVQRLASYAESVAHFPTAVKEVCNFWWRSNSSLITW